MTAAEVAAEKFNNNVSPRWVCRRAPGRLPGTRNALFFETAIDAWIAQLEKKAS